MTRKTKRLSRLRLFSMSHAPRYSWAAWVPYTCQTNTLKPSPRTIQPTLQAMALRLDSPCLLPVGQQIHQEQAQHHRAESDPPDGWNVNRLHLPPRAPCWGAMEGRYARLGSRCLLACSPVKRPGGHAAGQGSDGAVVRQSSAGGRGGRSPVPGPSGAPPGGRQAGLDHRLGHAPDDAGLRILDDDPPTGLAAPPGSPSSRPGPCRSSPRPARPTP